MARRMPQGEHDTWTARSLARSGAGRASPCRHPRRRAPHEAGLSEETHDADFGTGAALIMPWFSPCRVMIPGYPTAHYRYEGRWIAIGPARYCGSTSPRRAYFKVKPLARIRDRTYCSNCASCVSSLSSFKGRIFIRKTALSLPSSTLNRTFRPCLISATQRSGENARSILAMISSLVSMSPALTAACGVLLRRTLCGHRLHLSNAGHSIGGRSDERHNRGRHHP